MCNKDSNESTSKRKALELITNIFRKKSRDGGKSHHKSDENLSTLCSIKNSDSISSQSNSNSLSTADACLNTPTVPGYQFAPLSPVSPRVKNIDQDMEALTLSRNDNPIISQTLEKLSASGDFMSTSNLTLNISQPSGDNSNVVQSCISMEIDDLCDNSRSLHEHLIRSPPPQYPRYVSQFIFPVPGSPIGSLSLKNNPTVSPLRAAVGTSSDLSRTNTLEVPGSVQHRKSIALGETDQRDNQLSFLEKCRRGYHGSLDHPPEDDLLLDNSHLPSGRGHLTERCSSDPLSPSQACKDYVPDMYMLEDETWTADRYKEYLNSSREALISTGSSYHDLSHC